MATTRKEHIIVMGAIVICGFFAVSNPLYRDAKGATRTLESAGYQQIEILPYRYFSHCGRVGGPFIAHFKAATADGKPVSGKVCRSIFSDPSIRLDRETESAGD